LSYEIHLDGDYQEEAFVYQCRKQHDKLRELFGRRSVYQSFKVPRITITIAASTQILGAELLVLKKVEWFR
ncbi:MAG: hypothetical protein AAFR31_20305, partial [Cyanobacteria bacterium J06627_8]